jgi:hypothetical protein
MTYGMAVDGCDSYLATPKNGDGEGAALISVGCEDRDGVHPIRVLNLKRLTVYSLPICFFIA